MSLLHSVVLVPLSVLACLIVAVTARHHRSGFCDHLRAAVLLRVDPFPTIEKEPAHSQALSK